MAQQEEDGWPLGLQPLNVRNGLPRNGHFSAGSVSFNTLHTGSPASSTDSSSDFDTESTGSFFHDRSITLGSLIGASNIFDLSRKSRVRKVEASKGKRSNKKTKTWLFSLCSRDATETKNNAQSLGHFLAVERRAANGCRRNTTPSPNATIYRTGELPLGPSVMGWNPLFVDGHVAPPGGGQWHERRRNSGEMENGSLFSCMCGQLT